MPVRNAQNFDCFDSKRSTKRLTKLQRGTSIPTKHHWCVVPCRGDQGGRTALPCLIKDLELDPNPGSHPKFARGIWWPHFEAQEISHPV